MELLIVLTILVSLAALSVPSLRLPLARTELLEAAKQLRAELAAARLRAIESGAVQQFRFQRGSGRFEVRRRSASEIDEGPLFSGAAAARRAAAQNQPMHDEPQEQELAGDVWFCQDDGPLLSEPAAWAGPEEDDLLALLEAAEWSAPVFFYPDGRASNARMRLANGQALSVEVTLCGMTGVVKIGQLVRAEPQPEGTQSEGTQAEGPQP